MPGRANARGQDTWQNSITASVSKGVLGDPPSPPFPTLQPFQVTRQVALHLRLPQSGIQEHGVALWAMGNARWRRQQEALVHDGNFGHIALHNALQALHHAAAAAATGCECSQGNLSLMRQPLHMSVSCSLPELLWLATLSMTFPTLAGLPYCFGQVHAARSSLLLGCLLPLLLCLGKLCGPQMAHQGLHSKSAAMHRRQAPSSPTLFLYPAMPTKGHLGIDCTLLAIGQNHL